MESVNNLHFVWIGSQHDQTSIDRVKNIDNQCNVMLWLDESILCSNWKQTYDKFAITFQMKSDLLRLSALRKYGGLYIDFDCSLLSNVADIVQNWTTLTIPTLSKSVFCMGDIIYCPKDWKHWDLIDNYVENFNRPKLSQVSFGHVLFSSLPQHTINRIIDPKRFPSHPSEMSDGCLIRRYPISERFK